MFSGEDVFAGRCFRADVRTLTFVQGQSPAGKMKPADVLAGHVLLSR